MQLTLFAGCLLFGSTILGMRPRVEVHDAILVAFFVLGFVMLAGLGIAAIRYAWQMPAVTLELTPHGLSLHVPPGPGFIPWNAIEAAGLVRDDWSGLTAGLRLLRYGEFCAGARRDREGRLRQLRQGRGYEVQIPRVALDRPVEEFLDLLEDYLGRDGPTRESEHRGEGAADRVER